MWFRSISPLNLTGGPTQVFPPTQLSLVLDPFRWKVFVDTILVCEESWAGQRVRKRTGKEGAKSWCHVLARRTCWKGAALLACPWHFSNAICLSWQSRNGCDQVPLSSFSVLASLGFASLILPLYDRPAVLCLWRYARVRPTFPPFWHSLVFLIACLVRSHRKASVGPSIELLAWHY